MKWLVLSLVLTGAPPAMDPADLLTAAEMYVQGGKYSKAEPLLKKLVVNKSLTPEQQSRALNAMAMVKSASNDHDGAIKLLEESLALAETENTYFLLGMTYDTSERFQEARGTYEKGAKKFPKSVRLLSELGASELMLGDAHSALTHLAAALKLSSDDPELMRDYGEALLVTGRAAEAVKVLQDAREIDESNPHTATTLGDALAALGQTDKALLAYDDATNLDRAHGPAWFHKGLLLAKKGDYPAAVAAYRAALKVDPGNVKARLSLGVALSKLSGQEKEGVKLLRAVVEKEPTFAEAHAQLGLALEREGDLAGAEQSLADAVARRGDDARLYEELARIQEKRGKKKEAQATLKTAQKFSKGQPK